MKKYFALIFLISTGALAQQPYYSGLNLSKTGLELKVDLATRITESQSKILSYTPGIWEASKVTDLNPNNANEVLLIYGFDEGTTATINDNRTRGKDDNGGGSTQWNREHVYPRSLGNPNLGTEGAGADAHNLRPADPTRNSDRSNKRFIEGTGNSKSMPNRTWYPGDEWKGDIARMIMYMYLRYGDRCLPSVVGVGDNTNTPDDMIDLFLKWNAEDPPNAFEDQRNTYHDSNATYAQGNRNPFIDNPYLATAIWGGPMALDRWGISIPDTENPSTPTNLMASNLKQKSVTITWDAATDNTGVFNYEVNINNGAITKTSFDTTLEIIGLLSETTYSITVTAIDAQGNRSEASTAISITTAASSTAANEIFFSEYIEGAGLNRALEIANFTGAPIDLSIYDIRIQSDGVGDWQSKYELTSILPQGEVFTLVNAGAGNEELKQTADVLITNTEQNPSPLSFNGNDAIGLFKNNQLIDLIGNFDSSNDFSKNETLVRKATKAAPNIEFNKNNDWDIFPINTFENVGDHELNLNADTSTPPIPFLQFKVRSEGQTCPNVTNGKIIIETENTGNFNASIVDANTTLTTIDFTNQTNIEELAPGSYNLIITDKKFLTTYSFVINVAKREAIAVNTQLSANQKVLDVNLEGNHSFVVVFNNEEFITTEKNLSLNLKQGENNIEVKTTNDCQGKFNKKIIIGNSIQAFPNPVQNKLTIQLQEEQPIAIKIFSVQGKLISEGSLNIQNGETIIPMQQLQKGVYFIEIKGSLYNEVLKITKL